jgi:E3 ubiquitin-protein ligase TRIP12
LTIGNTVVAETVVGATTGVVPAPKGYFRGILTSRSILSLFNDFWKAMKSVCDKYGALLILDEVVYIPCL